MRFDPEEKEILESFERDEWRSVLDEEELERYRQYARYALRKTKRINLRISERDLIAIKKIAQKEGIPYQTLIASLIHKFVEEKMTTKTQL
ncbi:MAG TPA: antitoxin [Bacteroidetes bacterium]|nr:antitoxin [Bacteroidota bacterium]